MRQWENNDNINRRNRRNVVSEPALGTAGALGQIRDRYRRLNREEWGASAPVPPIPRDAEDWHGYRTQTTVLM
jgi:hypothetical protein